MRTKASTFLLAALIIESFGAGMAQDQFWSPKFPAPGAGVRSPFLVAVTPTRVVLVAPAGLFRRPRPNGGTEQCMIAVWDGEGWTAEAPGGVLGSISAVAVEGTDVYVGGLFTNVGGVAAANVARWDGTQWNPLGTGTNGSVRAIAATGTGTVYFGGEFTRAGDSLANRVARWNGSAWYPLYDQGLIANGVNGRVNVIQATASAVFVGGSFSSAGGQTGVGNVARWNATTPAWTRLGSGTNGEIEHIGAFGEEITVSGVFTTPAQSVARWSGTAWSAVGNPFVRPTKLEVAPNGETYASLFYTPTLRSIARFFSGVWQPLGNGVDLESFVMDATGTVLFANYQNGWIPGIVPEVAVRWDGAVWSGLGNGVGRYNNSADYVRGFAEYGGELYVSGLFTNAGPDSMANVARWNGSRWAAVPGFPANLPVDVLHASGGNLYAGGTFGSIGATTVNGIARWDGTGWRAMGAGLGAVRAIATHGGAIIAGGSFLVTGPPVLRSIARWTGSAWEPLRGGIYGGVHAIQDAGTGFYAGGVFTAADSGGTVSANNIARWDGTRWNALGAGVTGGSSPGVFALARRGTDLFVAGSFTTAGAVPANNIARWDGATWHALGGGLSGSVNALVANGTDLYAAGRFDVAGTDTVFSVARWDGTRWHRLGSGLRHASGLPSAHGMYGSSQGLYLGGNFTHAGMRYSNRIALWTNFSPVSVADAGEIPAATGLAQCYPNPFNGSTTIEFSMSRPGRVTLEVFDLLGRRVALLLEGDRAAGSYRQRFEAGGLSSGMYFYRLSAGEVVLTRRMVLLR